MKKILKLNLNDYNLYCIYSKERILVGEYYIEIIENYLGEEIIKSYKLDYLEVLEEEE